MINATFETRAGSIIKQNEDTTYSVIRPDNTINVGKHLGVAWYSVAQYMSDENIRHKVLRYVNINNLIIV